MNKKEILIVTEYENNFDKIGKEIEDIEGVNLKAEDGSKEYIRFHRNFFNGEDPELISISPNRIEYRRKEKLDLGKIDFYANIVDKLRDKYKKFINPKSTISFVGVVLKISCNSSLFQSNKEKWIFDKQKQQKENVKKKWYKTNFKDKENYNYNLNFVYFKEKKKVEITIDVNTRYKKTKQEKIDLEEIMERVNNFLKDDYRELKSLLQL